MTMTTRHPRRARLLDVETGRGPRRSRPARRRRRAGRRPSGRRPTGSPTARRSSTSATSRSCPGFIDTHSHLVGDVQTAGVPGVDDIGGAGRAHRRPPRPPDDRGRVHDRPRRRLVPGIQRLRPARRDRPRRRGRAADAVRRRVHHGAVGRWRRRRAGPRHRAARGPAVRGRDAPSTRCATGSDGCSSAVPTSSSASGPARS